MFAVRNYSKIPSNLHTDQVRSICTTPPSSISPCIDSKVELTKNSFFIFLETFFAMFEPFAGDRSIIFANGHDWEERRKALNPTLRDKCLEGYLPCFVEVITST